MNVRNINELEEMLARWRPKGMSETHFVSWLDVAMFLSSQGVLVPSALTQENIFDIIGLTVGAHHQGRGAARFAGAGVRNVAKSYLRRYI
jgi:hypothetical protein